MTRISLPPGSMLPGSASRHYLRADMALHIGGDHYTINGSKDYLAATLVPKPEPEPGKKHPIILDLDPKRDVLHVFGHDWRPIPWDGNGPKLMMQRVDWHDPIAVAA